MKVLLGLFLMLVVPLYSSDSAVSKNQDKVRTLYVATTDNETKTIPDAWLRHSTVLKDLCNNDPHLGSPIKPLKLTLDSDALSMVGTCLNFIEKEAVDHLKESYLMSLSLEYLIKLYKAALTLRIDRLIDLVVDGLVVQCGSAESLNRFMQSSTFLTSLSLDDGLKELLRKRIISKTDQNFLRSQLYTDLASIYRPTHFKLNDTNTLLLVGRAEGEKGCVDLWNIADGSLQQRIETAEPIRQVFFCRGPHIITVGAQGIALWNLLTRAQTVLNFGEDVSVSPWAACQSTDLTMMAFGSNKALYCVQLDKKTFCKIPFTGHVERHPVSNSFNPHLFFCGTDAPLLLCADSTGKLFFYDAQTGELLAEERAHSEKITHYLVQGNRCMTFSKNGQVCIWDGARVAQKRILHQQILSEGGCFASTVGVSTPLAVDHLLAFSPKSFKLLNDTSFLSERTHAPTFALDKQRNLFVQEEGTQVELPSHNTPEQLCMSGDQALLIWGSFDNSLRISHFCNTALKRYIAEELTYAQALSLKLLIQAIKKQKTISQGNRIDISMMRPSHVQVLYRSLNPLMKKVLASSFSEMRSMLGNVTSELRNLTLYPMPPLKATHTASTSSDQNSLATQSFDALSKMLTVGAIEVVVQSDASGVESTVQVEIIEPGAADTDDDSLDSDSSNGKSDSEENSASDSAEAAANQTTLLKGRSAPQVQSLMVATSSDDQSRQFKTTAEATLIEETGQDLSLKKGKVVRETLVRRNTGDIPHKKLHEISNKETSSSSASSSPRIARQSKLSQSDQLRRRSTLPTRVELIEETFVHERSFDDQQGGTISTPVPTYLSPRQQVSQKDHVALSLQYSRGKLAFNVGQYSEAFKLFSSLDETVDSTPEKANSHWWLGELYLNGWGTPFDFNKALKHFQAAQTQAEEKELQAAACERLGYMAYYGFGQQQDFKLAKDYFQQALARSTSNRTKALSSFRIGLILAADEGKKGEEAQKDQVVNSYQSGALASADVFRNQTSISKKEDAVYHALLGLIYSQGTARIANYKLAEQHLVEAGKSTNKFLLAEVQLLHGQLHRKEKMNLKKGRESLKKAAKQQANLAAAAQAALELGHIYAAEKSKASNLEKARTYYTQAASQVYDLVTQNKAATCLSQLNKTQQATSSKDK